MINFDRLFRSSIRDVKNSIFTHTFSYTQVSDACKSLKANGYRELQSSHNPLVLGSNPSGPSRLQILTRPRSRPQRFARPVSVGGKEIPKSNSNEYSRH
jgi:hypothetical protein